MTRFFATLAASTILASAPGWALQDEADAAAESDSSTTEWDVANPPLPTRAIPINVTEGTWMSLDVSPDGQTIDPRSESGWSLLPLLNITSGSQ